MFYINQIFNSLITLLVVIDPPCLVSIFISTTAGMSKLERRSTAIAASIFAWGILMLFALAGGNILSSLGISMGAFQIAGGILLFVIAFEMIFEKRSERREKTAQIAITKDHIRNIAAFPLALPMISGPGSISATILMSNNYSGISGAIISSAVILSAVIVCYIVMLMANPIDRILGETGRTIFTRLFGVILAAMAVQFVINGLNSLHIL